jgi:hypothetical protein
LVWKEPRRALERERARGGALKERENERKNERE